MPDETTEAPVETTEVSTTTESKKTEPDGLGDAGKAAIAAERKRASAAEKENKALKARLDDIESANQSETEKAINQARKEAAEAATAEVTKSFRDRILQSEVKALAATKFADPDDAIGLLKLEHDDVFDDDGEIQADVLSKQLDALLERKPHLRADPSQGRPTGDVDAGRGTSEAAGTPEEQHTQFLAGLLRQP